MGRVALSQEDEGCEVSASCLICPLSACKYDDPAKFLSAQRACRNQQIASAHHQEGATVRELQARFHLSQRTVYKILHSTP